MEIRNHRFADAWVGRSPNCGGALVKPTLLVMHFTASGGADPAGDVDWFLSKEARAAAHIVIGRDGTIRQVVPFDTKAWHAGVSIWRGEPNCNDYSIGIELDNWGRLAKAGDGQIRSYTGGAVEQSRAAWLQHKHEAAPGWWEIYTQAQLDRATAAARAILAAYPSIREIVGHEDIAPGRKVDPGPAFPMSRFVSLVTGRGDAKPVRRIVNAARLNARGGAGTQFGVLGQFAEGAVVDLLYDMPGSWAQVTGTLTSGEKVTAWVADQYLK